MSGDLVARANALSTCLISDSLAALGLPQLGLAGIVTLDLSARIAGPAFTVTCLPASESTGRRIEYLQEIPAGAVVVIANGGRLECSVWGGQRTLAARQRGAVGTVVDGAFRDIAEHAAFGYPVFAKGRTIVGSNGFANPVAFGEAVTLSGVAVSPGDFVVGDSSGVVTIPAGRVAEVLAHAEAEAAREQAITDAVIAGRDFFEAKKAAQSG